MTGTYVLVAPMVARRLMAREMVDMMRGEMRNPAPRPVAEVRTAVPHKMMRGEMMRRKMPAGADMGSKVGSGVEVRRRSVPAAHSVRSRCKRTASGNTE
jgi:hypothetical protein